MRRNFTLSFCLKFFLVCFLTASISKVNAQSDITIGTGTTGNTGTTYPNPLQDYFEGSRMQFLYLASELTAAGMGPGSISQIKFNVTALNGAGVIEDYNIKIGTTNVNSLSTSTWDPFISSTSTTAVLDYQPVLGMNTFTFTTPFFWNGTDNILIEICNGDPANTTGIFYTNNPTVPWTTGLSFNGSHTYRADNGGNLCNTATATNTGTQTTRPNATFNWSPAAACSGTPTAGTATSSVASACSGETFSLSLSGATVASGITYQWQSSPDNASWTSIPGATTSSYSTSQTSSTYYRAIVTCTNGGASTTSNSVEVITPDLVSGTFTINNAQPTSGTNFQSFNDAYNHIKCGIDGPVIFNVVAGSGPYNEQLIMDEIPGASATNTIRFNGNGATITFNSTNSNQRAVIKLNGADHITFNNLIITAPGTTTSEYGWGVQLINNADSNTISNSFINLNTTSTSTNYAGIVVSSSETSATTNGNTLSDGNTFLNNTITGGYYGITLVGSTTAASFISENKVVGNTIQDYYTYGILIDGTAKTLVEANNLKRPTRTDGGATIYGIYFTGASTGARVSKNRIHNMFDSYATTADNLYGIYFTSADATAGNENVVSNNLIYDIKSNGLIYGIYNLGSNYAHYYHNTISLDDASSTSTEATRGFYQTTTASGIEFKNNIITITRGGTGDKHVIYMATTATTYNSNYNDFYISSGTNHYIGRNGTVNLSTLTDWQTATGKDANSVSIDPLYQNRAGENYSPTASSLDNLGTPVGITSDIENKPRSATTPDIGAYEFSVNPCTSPPTAGTVVVSETGAVCPNTPVSFNLSGNSIGIGQTYQWESAPSTTGPWTAISGSLTSPPFDHTVGTQTLYYRAAVTCSGSTSYSTPIQIVVNPLFPGGTYTINSAVATGGTNFQSFNDAYNAMRCGISGPVVFNVASGSGPYNEQLIMGQIQGTSASNTITFNGNGATIAYTSVNANERAVIKLNGTDYVTFDSLTINATGTTTSQYGYGIQIMNDADFNTINNSKININTSVSSTNYAGIVVSNSHTSATATGETQSDNITLSNNTITGGYYGITLVGSSTLANQNARIVNNLIQEFYLTGIYVNGSFNALIEKNTITRPTRSTVSTFNGIYFTGLSTSANITKNIITNPFGGAAASTSTFNGIYFTGVDAFATLENIVSNNLIYGLNGNGDVNGIYNSSSNNVWYYHNTLSLDGSSPNTTSTDFTRGFYQTTSASGIEFKNNIINISQGGVSAKTALYFNTPASTIISDYNNLYISSINGANNIGFYNGNEYDILLNWQTGTSQDANSISNDPVFENPSIGNYKPTNAVTDNRGTPVGILVDILNAPRSTTTPDIGAYEFSPAVCVSPPTAGTAVVSESPVCENTLVQLSSIGYSTGLGQTYQWQASNDSLGVYANISGVLSNPSFTITASSTFYYRLAVTCNGNTQYSTPVLLFVNPGLPGGTYTIDNTQPQSATNFVSFNAAKDAMSCGITGPVIFNVEPNTGPYLEQLVLDSIRGASADNTITFNGNGNVIQFSSSTSAERAVIKLNGADHVTFDSLIINATGTGTYGWGVQLTNNADSNTFRRNRIITDTTSTSTTSYGGVIISSSATSMTTGSSLSDGNIFDRNRIIGGYYGVTVIGTSAAPIHNNKFINNAIEEFYTYGFYISGTNNTLIEQNTVTRPARSDVSSFYGIYFTGVSSNGYVAKNIVTNPFGGETSSTSAAYGIYFSGVDAPTGQENKVINNLLYNFNGSGIIYALYNSSSDNVHYYHNTISLDNTSSTSTSVTRGFYQTTTAQGIEFKNNIITVSRGGTGEKHAIYMGTPATTYTSDHNNFYVVPGTNHFIGSLGTADHATLASWQAATSQDANSVSVDPQYTNPAAGNFTPLQGFLDNKGTPVGVLIDILGNPRSATNPDIGAYEFSVNPCTEPPTAGVSVANPSSGICLGNSIALGLSGNSAGGFQKYVWQRASSATGPWTNISDTLFVPDFNHNISTTDAYFRASVTCGASTNYSTPVQININPPLLAGDYTIDPALPAGGTNFKTFSEAVQALHCGIAGSVRFHAMPGSYNEQIRIRRVPGASESSTVTFMSQNGNAGSVTLTYNATDATSNYVLKLDSASYIIFKNISISAQNSDFGRAVELAGTSSKDSLLNNIITVPVSTSTSNTVAGIFGTSLRGSDIVIKGNTISGGSSSIYLSGTTNVSNRYVIESNSVTGSYYYGIYTGNISRITIHNNKVTRSGILNTSAYGIYVTNCDSAFQINNNHVTINNTGTTLYGIYITGNQAAATDEGKIANNKIIATTGNTGNLYGIYQSASTFSFIVNNVVNINTGGASSYGIYSTGGGDIRYYNNSVNSTSTSASNNYAAYFTHTSGSGIDVRNNIFSHKARGLAMFVANTSYVYSDYNMLYTAKDSVLVRSNTPAGDHRTLQAWRNATSLDLNSIVFEPVFSNDELMPNIADSTVWAMHGRGLQLPGNSNDINNNPRPVTLTAGVPDLGAYEFVPISVPFVLQPNTAPAVGVTQYFMLGTDTVSKITWRPNSAIPASVTVRRYSGVVPAGMPSNAQYMYFYVDMDPNGATGTLNYDLQQFYIDSWQGFIPREAVTRLGRTNASNTWIMDAASKVDTVTNVIRRDTLNFMDKFTGMTDPSVVPPPPPVFVQHIDSSNAGRQFWVGYGHHYGFSSNGQDMVLYLSTEQAANVQVKVNGTNYVRNYLIPANTAISSDIIPKAGLFDARLLDEGKSNRGISISSDVPIVAYAHIYQGSNSGASMLLPTGVYGYEYISLNSSQYYPTGGAGSYSWFYVIADRDSTVVEITPSVETKGGRPAGVPFTVMLNRGEVYNVMGTINGAQGTDLTGSRVRSIPNASGNCYPIAVFSGSSRTAICHTTNGDNLIQQVFPSQAWGTKYATFATAVSTSNTNYNSNLFRVMVKDPTTVVTKNGVVLNPATLITPGNYYQFNTTLGGGPNGAVYIQADKPVLVAQYMVSDGGTQCPGVTTDGVGDPEMIYISPLEQGINKAVFYTTEESSITSNYINVVLPTAALSSLTIDGVSVFTDVFPHPYLPGYSAVRQNLGAASGQHVIQSDSAFTAFVYGLGSVESYGYNAGTLVKNLNAIPFITNTFTGGAGTSDYTCRNAPFRFTILIPLKPTQLTWRFSQVAGLSSNVDSVQTNPVPVDSTLINGRMYYRYTVARDYSFSTTGNFNVPIIISHPSIEGCNNNFERLLTIRVNPSPVADFSVNFSRCVGDVAQFTGTVTSAVSGVTGSSYNWNFGDNTTSTAQNPTKQFNTAGTYSITLRAVTSDGCVGDTTKQVSVNARPTAAFVTDSVTTCPGTPATLQIQNPATGATYNWYTTPTGGTPIHTGTSYAANVSVNTSYYVEAIINGCASTTRARAVVAILPTLAIPVVQVVSSATTPNSITFSWTPVPGATGYEVSTDNGTTWTVPSSGATGTTHTVSGLAPLASVTLIVRALGGCQETRSLPVTQRTPTDQVFIPNSFTPNGDGLNDVLLVYGHIIRSMQFTVFNQWGEKIFESRDQARGWDGSYKGKQQPSGVYMYVAKFTLNDGTQMDRKGTINLVR